MIKSIGFIGLGTVGKHMALNLLKGQLELSVYDRDPKNVADLVAAGAQEASDALTAAKGKDLVIVVLPEVEEMQAALSEENGFIEGIGPETQVWGTKEHAVNGLLTVLAGGDVDIVNRCREVFSFFGLNIIHVGEIGDATRMKFVVNLMQAHIIEGLAEGFLFGEKFGFDAEKILEVLESGGITSPLMNLKGRRIARGDFSRNLALKYVHEGLALTNEIAKAKDLKLPAAEAVCSVYAQAVANGYGEEDFSSVIKSLQN